MNFTTFEITSNTFLALIVLSDIFWATGVADLLDWQSMPHYMVVYSLAGCALLNVYSRWHAARKEQRRADIKFAAEYAARKSAA